MGLKVILLRATAIPPQPRPSPNPRGGQRRPASRVSLGVRTLERSAVEAGQTGCPLKEDYLPWRKDTVIQNCAWDDQIANGEVVRAQGPPLETGTPPPAVPQAPGPPVVLGLGSFFYRAPFLALCPGRPICPGLPVRCPDLYVP